MKAVHTILLTIFMTRNFEIFQSMMTTREKEFAQVIKESFEDLDVVETMVERKTLVTWTSGIQKTVGFYVTANTDLFELRTSKPVIYKKKTGLLIE